MGRKNSLILATLGTDLSWYIATNVPALFKTVKQAVQFAEKNKIVENRRFLGTDTCPFIVGPRFGTYSIFSGRILK